MTAPLPLPWERLARAYTHPLKIAVLELLTLDGGRSMSPNELRVELGEPLSNVAYHVKGLAEGGFIEQVATAKRRGAIEHFYALAEGRA